jgi:putative SOS response-associated peptidase YedK
MCGRITLSRADADEVAEILGASVAPELAYRPRWNVAPTDVHPIVHFSTGKRILAPAAWGFPNDGHAPAINARAETVASRPLFRDAFAHRRCVVPADGFFEWTGPKGHRRPIWFHAPSGALLAMAGLWELDEMGRMRFTVLTTPPNARVAEIHDRMPALLPLERLGDWLRAPDAKLLHPAPDDALVGVAVSDRVNSVANDDPACLTPATPPRQLPLL